MGQCVEHTWPIKERTMIANLVAGTLRLGANRRFQYPLCVLEFTRIRRPVIRIWGLKRTICSPSEGWWCTTPGPSNAIPCAFLEPFVCSWSHFVVTCSKSRPNLHDWTFDGGSQGLKWHVLGREPRARQPSEWEQITDFNALYANWSESEFGDPRYKSGVSKRRLPPPP